MEKNATFTFYSQQLFCHFFVTFCNSAVEPDGENDQDDDHLPSRGNPPAENRYLRTNQLETKIKEKQGLDVEENRITSSTLERGQNYDPVKPSAVHYGLSS